jgi:hypothetical protein
MKKIKRTGLFAILCIMLLVSAPYTAMAADEGLEYTVQKGDTLWDISSGKLKDPLLWPKLWKANPHIHNPHLIYPNEKVVIPADLLKEELRGERMVKLDTKRKLLAKEYVTVTGTPKRPIVDRETLLQSGYFIGDMNPAGKIVAAPLGKTLFGIGDTVYLSTDVKTIASDKFYVVTKPEAMPNPLNKKQIVGYLVRIKGVTTVSGDENGKTKAVISESYKEITIGDMLINYYAVALPYEPATIRKPHVDGVVLGIWNKRAESGKYDVVYLDAGAGQGIEIGDVFTVTSGTEPKPVIGNVQVFAVSDAGSAAIIKKAMSEIKPGDTFGN